MRDIDVASITAAVNGYIAPHTDPRLRLLLEKLVIALHDYVRDVRPTHAEWRAAIDFLTHAGRISTDERNEFMLTSDTLGVSSLVDMVNSVAGDTESSVLGPFHILGAPEIPVGADLRRNNPGDAVVVSGTVRDNRGEPIAGAMLEIWQTAANGLYSNQDPEQPDFNLRASMRATASGRYAFTTVKPEPYTIPQDGPVGGLFRALGRSPWRPSHLHVIVRAEGYRTIVTELFPSDDPYLDSDAVLGVRRTLVIEYKRREDRSAVAPDLEGRADLPIPFYVVDYDFVLSRAPQTRGSQPSQS